jgi:hypothetical protein
MKNKYINKVGLAMAVVVLFFEIGVANAQYVSNNYAANEVFFGIGGTGLNAESSNHYLSQVSVGETGVGSETGGSRYSAVAGFNTYDQPFLAFVVNTGNVDLGPLAPSTAATANATFWVRDYQSTGYAVITNATPPKTASHTMTNLTTPTSSIPGNEQFGINLEANTSPVSFGAAPVQQPDSSFSYGQVATGYNTPNYYEYIPGSEIAYSNKSSGETDYTISFLYNVSATTPTGLYVFNDMLIATGTY